MPRSSFYAARERARRPQHQRQQEPPTVVQSLSPTKVSALASRRWTDAEALAEIRRILTSPDFSGEGYRKVWARLRHAGVRVWKDRVLRLMRENHLLSPDRRPPAAGQGQRSSA